MAAASFIQRHSWLLIFAVVLVILPGRASAFGAGNIPSIAQVEGQNWRHGDIEDMLTTIAFLRGKKWSSMAIKRVYFGNWLRDYSQALDVGSLKGPVNAETIRILIWVLAFMSFGYATEEFEVTADRLGVYRAEEHIDNPLGYADGADARKYDERLRGPVQPIETEIDPRSGMKNYIANESGNWSTSAGYLRYSLGRSIHYGREYTSGSGRKGKEEDLCEALRCLGQSLHCLEDFSAHSNYCELVLNEMGLHGVFAHCGTDSRINLGGKYVFPLVTGTFGAVDFLHSVIGEATDQFTQAEVDEVDVALLTAEKGQLGNSGGTNRSFGGRRGSSASSSSDFISMLGQIPNVGGGFASQARSLRAASEEQERINQSRGADNVNLVPGMSTSFDPVETSRKIYPILEFRDKIARAIHSFISKIPGLEKLLDTISERLTAFVLGLLTPFIRPIIKAVSASLKDGSSGIISASEHSQLGPWKNSRCTDPTHSMLAKDHFTNLLNSCAGRVASTVLQYAVPRVLYAWENPGVPVDEVVNDILQTLHHPALRNDHVEIHRNMFNTVRKWYDEHPRRSQIEHLLSSESVKNGHNHVLHGSGTKSRGGGHSHGDCGHGKTKDGLWSKIPKRDLDSAGPGMAYGASSGQPASHENYGYSNDGSNPPYGAIPSMPSVPGRPGAQDSYWMTGSESHGSHGHSAYGSEHQQPYQQQHPQHGQPPYGQPPHGQPPYGQQHPPHGGYPPYSHPPHGPPHGHPPYGGNPPYGGPGW
ncbi:hypothetical protein CFIMG_000273RA [Ceratocystis fimbriata CBS 114723]|uniref:Uncharacterized protein n=1 Tax=Ceratocystis fimbriata CBS 114723 TaxID=1035309 RepID=A0A2C5XJI5_9PEZI|nr:hypothetical protein CFIMG_000273RA [Ceratocystis fimbriata CBS 114723]